MRGGGEYGLLTIELAASLAAHNMPVTPEQRDELLALLEAMGMPTHPNHVAAPAGPCCSGRPGRPAPGAAGSTGPCSGPG